MVDEIAVGVEDDEGSDGGEGVDVGTFVAMGGIDAKGDEGGTDIVAGFEGGGAVAAVVAEDIALVFDFVAPAEVEEVVGKVVIERAGGIGHGDGDAGFAGILSRADGTIVDTDHFGDIAMEDGGGTGADLLGDGEEEVAFDGQFVATFGDGFGGGEHGGNAGFIVEMAGIDEAIGEGFGAGIDADEVADLNAEAAQVSVVIGMFIDP